MLAVKLHKKKKAFLGNGSHCVPVLNWETGKVVIKNWIQMLNRNNRNRPNNQIRYITLVRIPRDHRVILADDWMHFNAEEAMFGSISESLKGFIFKWQETQGHMGSFEYPEGCFRTESAMGAFLPELVLKEPLPGKQVLWTKDVRLLYKTSG